MFCIAPLIFQLFVVLIRPQEIAPSLQSLSLVYLTLGLSLTGLAIDLRVRAVRPRAIPHTLPVALFFAWAIVTVGINASNRLTGEMVGIVNVYLLYLLIGHGVQTFRGIQALASFLIVVLLFLAILGVHQGLAPHVCFQVDSAHPNDVGVPDGRGCDETSDCRRDGEPGREYHCEHAGMLETSSIGDRVRYRGVLEDPNELSLATCLALPFAFALYQRRKSALRGLMAGVAVVAIGACTVFTQSRGGQLVFLVVIGTYALRIFGLVRGLLFGSVFVIPIVSLGGRSGDSADESSLERLGCWKTGIDMFRHAPLFGVGKGQFVEHHYLTAHNAYVLVAAELGVPGLFLFMAVIFLSIKIPLASLRYLEHRTGPEAEEARAWSVALLASLAGMAAGIFFLSLSYHPVVWVHLGLTGSLASAMRRRYPDFEVGITAREFVAAGVGCIGVLALVYVYATSKGA